MRLLGVTGRLLVDQVQQNAQINVLVVVQRQCSPGKFSFDGIGEVNDEGRGVFRGVHAGAQADQQGAGERQCDLGISRHKCEVFKGGFTFPIGDGRFDGLLAAGNHGAGVRGEPYGLRLVGQRCRNLVPGGAIFG